MSRPMSHVRPADRPSRHAAESWSAASSMHARVVGAVIMRDLQTRFGTGYFGFLLGLVMPLGHLTVAIGVTLLLGRPAPLGSDNAVFLMTGVLPFILWLYSHRQIMLTLAQNRPLLYFPGVDVFDLFAARIILEVVTGTLVVIIVLATLSILGHDLLIYSWRGFVFALILSWILGIATGLAFGALGAFAPVAFLFGNIIGPLLWAISGIFFLPDSLPDVVRTILSYNPLCQIIDCLRVAYYSEYSSSFFDPYILYVSILVLLAVGMIFIPIVRKVV
ncbi:hypothetical protein ABLE93_08535 [Xanthobacter sp. KR7-65]|uniref:ABC transporter permease n=1 Tax=Xanthobacter sp. KR7-65 TaxID=3156612 RepID=UPI0032B41405